MSFLSMVATTFSKLKGRTDGKAGKSGPHSRRIIQKSKRLAQCNSKFDYWFKTGVSDCKHLLTCSNFESSRLRHSQANDIIKQVLVSADYQSCLESNGLCASTANRPDGMTLLLYIRGKPLAWDFTCRHRLAATLCNSRHTAGLQNGKNGRNPILQDL